MPTPADKLAQVLTDALNQWVKDNPDLFKTQVSVTGGGSGQSSGGENLDLIGIILGLAALGVSLNPENFAITQALDQAQSNAGKEGAAIGSAWFIGETALKFSEPYTRILTHALEASVVSEILDPATAAEMQAQGIIGHDEAVSEAAGSGLDGQHVSWLVEHSMSYPGLVETLRLWNLGYLQEPDVDLALERAKVPAQYRDALKQLRRQYLSVADLALGNLRGDISDADAQAYAAQLGMTEEDFTRFVFNTGEPIGLMQLLEAYRRDYIDKARLQHGVRQSRVKDEWFDVILDLRYERMSAANAVDATVQNHLTADQGLAAAKVAGLHPDDFPVLLETAGEPLSRTEMTELVNRREATVEQYAQAMRESRLKDKYIPLAEKLLVKLIPYRTINTIIAHGVRDQKWGIEYLMKLGYTEDDASALISTSASGKVAHIKQLTEAQILTLWEAKAIKQDEAVKQLGNIGYAPDEAAFILEYTTAKRAISEQNKAITMLRTAFMAHRVSLTDASAAMDKLGVPPEQRDQLKSDWEIERGAQVRVLTVPEITAAVNYGVVEFADAQAKLVEMGYSDNEAKVVICAAIKGVPKGVTISPISGTDPNAPGVPHGFGA